MEIQWKLLAYDFFCVHENDLYQLFVKEHVFVCLHLNLVDVQLADEKY